MAALIAPACAACGNVLEHPIDGPICPACWAAVRPLPPPLCPRCGGPLASWRADAGETCAPCRRAPGVIAAARAAAAYDGPLRDIIHAFKYDPRRSLARPLGVRMRETGAPLLAGAACVVPVPLHPWRRFRRGFNQASALARELGPPVVPALWRRRATRAQAGLSAAARRTNLRDGFRVSPLLTSRQRALLDGRTVVLVDDVRTTGATLDACARVLLTAGAREVTALTAAFAARPP